jgi:hypothetical protein
MNEKGKRRRRRSSFLRALEDRRDAARQQAAQEDTDERESEAETPLTRFLLPSRKRRPNWR